MILLRKENLHGKPLDTFVIFFISFMNIKESTPISAKKSYPISNSMLDKSQINHCNNAKTLEKLLLYTDDKPVQIM